MSFTPPAFLKNSTLEYTSASAYFLDTYKKVNDDLYSTKQELEEKTQTLDELLSKVNSVAETSSALKSENKSLRSSIETLRKEIQLRDSTIETFRGDSKGMIEENQQLIKANHDLSDFIESIEGEKETLSTKLEAESEGFINLKVEYEKWINSTDNKNELLIQKSNEYERSLYQKGLEIEEKNILITQLKTKLSQLNVCVEGLQHEKKILAKDSLELKQGEGSLQELLLLKNKEINQLDCDRVSLSVAFQKDKDTLQANFEKECKKLGEQYKAEAQRLKEEHNNEMTVLTKELNELKKKNKDMNRVMRSKIISSKDMEGQIKLLKKEKEKLEKAVISLNNIVKVFTT